MEIFTTLLNAFSHGDWRYLFHAFFELVTFFFIVYGAIYFFRGSRASYISLGIFSTLIVATFCAYLFDFTVITWITNQFWAMIVIAFIVIFQPELRRFFGFLGQGRFVKPTPSYELDVLKEIVVAMQNLSRSQTGALIVLERDQNIRAVCALGGTSLECRVCAPLLESIFVKNSPLHDGAVIIKNGTITAAHMVLPLSHSSKIIANSYGTRHRAALGISEETDAIALLVSEETAHIAVAHRGFIQMDVPLEHLQTLLEELLTQSEVYTVDTIVKEERI